MPWRSQRRAILRSQSPPARAGASPRRQVEAQISALQERQAKQPDRAQGTHERAAGTDDPDPGSAWKRSGVRGRSCSMGAAPGGSAPRAPVYRSRDTRGITPDRRPSAAPRGSWSSWRRNRATAGPSWPSIAAEEGSSRAQLLNQQATRKGHAGAPFSLEIATQRRSVAVLEHDEARLGSLIDQISRLPRGTGHAGMRPRTLRLRRPCPTVGHRARQPFIAPAGQGWSCRVDGQLGARFRSRRAADEDGQAAGPALPAGKGLFYPCAGLGPRYTRWPPVGSYSPIGCVALAT